MAVIVQKFGGTSLEGLEAIQRAAGRALCERQRGHQVVVVTSAMALATDQLCKLAAPCQQTGTAEHDVLLASGEQVTASLMALCLQQQGVKSRSFLSWQLPVVTDTAHGQAVIQHIDTAPLKRLMDEGGIAVVAGFQGVTSDGRLSTLGRGGSDITALALAAFLKKNEGLQDVSCHIYTDVHGVCVADPRLVPHAKKLDVIDYDTMHHMAEKGAHVLHPKSILYAKAHHIPLLVRSSFADPQPANNVAPMASNPEAGQGTWLKQAASLDDVPFLMAATKGWCVFQDLPASTPFEHFMQQLATKHPHACVKLHALSHQAKPVLALQADLLRAYQTTLGSFLTEVPLEDCALLSLQSQDPEAFARNDTLAQLQEKLLQQAVEQEFEDTLWSAHQKGEWYVCMPQNVLPLSMRLVHDVCYAPHVFKQTGEHSS